MLEADWAEAGVDGFRMGERHAAVAAATFVEETDATAKDLRILDGADHPAEHCDETCIVRTGLVELTSDPDADLRLIGEDHASVAVALYAVLKEADLDVVSWQLDLAVLLVALLTNAGGEVGAGFGITKRQHCAACQSEGGKGLGVEVRTGCCVIVSHVAGC